MFPLVLDLSFHRKDVVSRDLNLLLNHLLVLIMSFILYLCNGEIQI